MDFPKEAKILLGANKIAESESQDQQGGASKCAPAPIVKRHQKVWHLHPEEFPKEDELTDSYRGEALIETNDKLSLHAEFLSVHQNQGNTIGARYL